MRLSPTTIARCVFIVLCLAVGILATRNFNVEIWKGALGGFLLGVFVVVLDILLKNLSFRGFSHATFGLLVGLFCGWLIDRVVQGVIQGAFGEPSIEEVIQLPGSPGFIVVPVLDNSSQEKVEALTRLGIFVAFGFWGMSLAMRSNRQEFSFIIPYVRFRQDSAHDLPLLVDTNVIIDGRIPSICATGFLSGSVIVPHFVLDELHTLADSKDAIKGERGKRGLECLNQMQSSRNIEVAIQEDYQSSELPVDTKLIQFARRLGARLLTNDSNLGKVAQLQGVTVLNLNQLAHAMRPIVVPGEAMYVNLVREGKDDHQAVGYLEDGTMIVVNHAIQYLGNTVPIILGSPLQTSAGRLIFAELDNGRLNQDQPLMKG